MKAIFGAIVVGIVTIAVYIAVTAGATIEQMALALAQL